METLVKSIQEFPPIEEWKEKTSELNANFLTLEPRSSSVREKSDTGPYMCLSKTWLGDLSHEFYILVTEGEFQQKYFFMSLLYINLRFSFYKFH